MTKKRILILAAIVLVGLGLRLALVDQAQFGTNEARDYERALAQVNDGKWQAYGLEVFGLEARLPGAAYYWILSIPAALSDSPRAMSAFIAVVNAAGVWLLFLVARRVTRDERLALLAAFLYAVSPWPLQFAAKIWNPYLAPPAALLFILALLRWTDAPRSRPAAFLVFPLAAVAAQLHVTALPLLLLPFLFLWARTDLRRDGWFWAGVGTAVAAAGIPFVLAEAAAGWPHVAALFSGAGAGGARPEALRIVSFSVLCPSVELSAFFTDRLPSHLARLGFPGPFAWAFLLALPVSLWFAALGYRRAFGAARAARRAAGGWRAMLGGDAGAFTLAAWIAGPVLFVLATLKPAEPRYVAVFLPAAFIALALALRPLLLRWPGWPTWKRALLALHLAFPLVVAAAWFLLPIPGRGTSDYTALERTGTWLASRPGGHALGNGAQEARPPFRRWLGLTNEVKPDAARWTVVGISHQAPAGTRPVLSNGRFVVHERTPDGRR